MKREGVEHSFCRVGLSLGVAAVGGLAGGSYAQSTGMAKPYRLVWVDDLVNSYGALQVRVFPDGEGDGAAPEVMRFRIDEAGNIVGTAIEPGTATSHARAAIWAHSGPSGAGAPTRTRLPFPGMTVGGTTGVDTVATSVSTAGGVLRIGGGYIQSGVCTPALWSASIIPGTSPSLSGPTQLWSANDSGLVQAVGVGATPMIGGAIHTADICNRPLPFMHDTAGPASPTGAIEEDCGYADEAETVPMSMWGSTYAIYGTGLTTFGFGWRVCFPCEPFSQPLCGPFVGNVQHEQFARWLPGAGAGAWQYTPTGCVTTESRAVSVTSGAVAGWSVSRGCDSAPMPPYACMDMHATVMAFGTGTPAFMDIHGALNTFDSYDAWRTCSKAAAITEVPASWCNGGEGSFCPTWLVGGAWHATLDGQPFNFGAFSPRGVVWQGNALGYWCGKRAEALSVNRPAFGAGTASLAICAVHGFGPGGTAVAIGYLAPQEADSSYWGTSGFKLVLMTHPADFDGDLHVAGNDLGALLGHWGTTDSEFDLDGSGLVDGPDLGILLGGFTGSTAFVTIPKWDCSGGWHVVPVVVAGTVASQMLGFEDLEALGAFAATLPSPAADSLLLEAAMITQSLLE